MCIRDSTNLGPNILLFITAVGPPAVLASLKPLNNIIQLPLHVPCIVSNNYTAIGSGLYITKTRCLLIYWTRYVHTYLQCYTLVLVVRAVWNCGWQREWSFSFPIVLLFVVVLRIFTGRNTFVPAVLDHTPCMVVFALWNRGWQSELSSIVLTTTNRSIVIK